MSADGFHNFYISFCEEKKILLASMKSLTTFENPSRNPLQEVKNPHLLSDNI
jgi:hypothetical protein